MKLIKNKEHKRQGIRNKRTKGENALFKYLIHGLLREKLEESEIKRLWRKVARQSGYGPIDTPKRKFSGAAQFPFWDRTLLILDDHLI